MVRAALILAAVVAMGCAHERVAVRNGCWVKLSESRMGDSREQVLACEPKKPARSADPLLGAIEQCTFQAQMAWYNAALQQIRAGKEPPTLADARKIGDYCVSDAHRMALDRITKLSAETAGLEDQREHLLAENEQLRDTLVQCVEKQPNAIAEATATTNSNSTADTNHSSSSEKVRRVTNDGPPEGDIVRAAGRTDDGQPRPARPRPKKARGKPGEAKITNAGPAKEPAQVQDACAACSEHQGSPPAPPPAPNPAGGR